MNPARLLVLLVTLPLLLGGCGEKHGLEGVNWDELEEREGIRYLVNSEKPFTGKSVSLHANGQKYIEQNWKDGKRDGLYVRWWENGHKGGQANYKGGKLDGLSVSWHNNGRKAGQVNYKEGEEVSAKYWNSKGEPVDTIEEAIAE